MLGVATAGGRTVWADSAEAALAELASGADRFDAVFSGVVMPGMHGIELGQRIRRDHHDLPVALTSGYSHVLAQNGTHGSELLRKPYSIEQLSRVLRKAATWQRRRRIMAGWPPAAAADERQAARHAPPAAAPRPLRPASCRAEQDPVPWNSSAHSGAACVLPRRTPTARTPRFVPPRRTRLSRPAGHRRPAPRDARATATARRSPLARPPAGSVDPAGPPLSHAAMNTPRPALLLAALLAAPAAAHADPRQPRLFDSLALSPDGAHVASVEHDEPAVDGDEPVHRLVLRAADGSAEATVALPCGEGPDCRPSDIAFSPDNARLAFVLKQPGDSRSYVFEVAPDGTGLSQRLAFDGALGGLRYGLDGRLAMLAIPGAHKEAGAVKPGEAPAGEIGVASDEQRIAILDGSALRLVSPPDLYVYEFDWRPAGAGFVATAAAGNGDNQWWVARLWAFPEQGTEHDRPRVLYAPPPQQQLAAPAVSPDGRSVAFIGGIMSDFGSTGGDAYTLALDAAPGARPVNLTPAMPATVTALDWRCPGGGLTATALHGADAQVLSLGAPSAHPRPLWSGPQSLRAGGWSHALTCSAHATAAIHETFSAPPEIEIGPIGGWHDLTRANAELSAPVTARSLEWTSDGHAVQGWLLQPAARPDASGAATSRAAPRQKMITMVHGGPGAASTPAFMTESRDRWLLDAGYDLFLPNPRGSFGGGEAFTLGNRRDFGHGDLRDILRGVDAALAAAPIDPAGLGLMGYSYGGYMTMWTVTQTTRFRAAVAGAGVSNWQSYYGENGIDQWMIPYFGASVYDDPAIYARSSPMTYIRQVRTPTFEFVGDRDLECPMPQTQEFWHALNTLGVPTEFVVYPGQGHELHDAHDRADAKARTLAWFARWLGPRKS